MKKFGLITFLIISLFVFQSHINRVNNSNFPPINCTGAPNAFTCQFCHSSFAENMPGGSISLQGIPASFSVGKSYPFSINIHHFAKDRKKFGYDLTALDANGNQIGTITTNNAFSTINSGELTSHNPPTLAATDSNVIGGFSWNAPAIAPTPDQLPITFYFCGNATNADGTTLNDYVYNDSTKTTLGLLPITNNRLSIINSNAGNVQLAWKFANVSYIKYYIVQKSADFYHFINIDTLNIANNFSGVYIDKTVNENEVSYYRIMSVDGFGIISYSNVEKYSPKINANNEVYVFPNPIEKFKMLTVNIQSPIKQIGDISIINNAGKLIYQTKINLFKGNNSYQLALDNRYTFGMYHLIYQSNSKEKIDSRFLVK